jgi:hypothetical protein
MEESFNLVRMNPRQWATYRLIESNSLEGRTTTLNEVFANYCAAEHPSDGYRWNESDKRGNKCRAVWDDIQTINNSLEIDKIVVVENYTYRIGTEEECEAYWRYLHSKAMSLLKRASDVACKMQRNFQGKLLSNQGNAIADDSGEKQFYETYFSEEEKK